MVYLHPHLTWVILADPVALVMSPGYYRLNGSTPLRLIVDERLGRWVIADTMDRAEKSLSWNEWQFVSSVEEFLTQDDRESLAIHEVMRHSGLDIDRFGREALDDAASESSQASA